MGGEDFSYMLEARPGGFIFIGSSDTINIHHPAYDFNNEVTPPPHCISYWVRWQREPWKPETNSQEPTGSAPSPLPLLFAENHWRILWKRLCIQPSDPVAQ